MKRGAPLRRTPLRAASKKRARENRERKRALEPLRAAQEWCSRCGVTGVGLDADERRSRARGGSATDLANVQLLCRPCHDWKHSNDLAAQAEGWSESQYAGGAA